MQTHHPCSALFLFCRSSLLFDMYEVILQLGSLWLEAWLAAVPGTPAKKIFWDTMVIKMHQRKRLFFFFFHIIKYLNPGRAFPALQALSIYTQSPWTEGEIDKYAPNNPLKSHSKCAIIYCLIPIFGFEVSDKCFLGGWGEELFVKKKKKSCYDEMFWDTTFKQQ